MESLIQSIQQFLINPFNSLIVAVIVGILANLITDKLLRRIKRIWWGSKRKVLKDHCLNERGEVDVSYVKIGKRSYEKILKTKSICRFIFWSSGKDTLLENDISNFSPLIISFNDGCKILEIRDIVCTNPSINFQIISNNQINLSFEYLERDQGATFDIIYAGNSASPYLTGVIKGGKVNMKKMSPPPITPDMPKLYLLLGWLKPAQQILVIRWFSTISCIVLFWALIMFRSFVINPDPNTRWQALLLMICCLYIYAIISIWVWQIAIVPIRLRKYYSSIN